MNRENNNSETGAIMVEAAIYFPITIGIVMVVLYFGLFKLQESYFFFQVERVVFVYTHDRDRFVRSLIRAFG